MNSVSVLNKCSFAPVLACFATGIALGATNHAAILQEAANAMDDDYMQECAYTETSI